MLESPDKGKGGGAGALRLETADKGKGGGGLQLCTSKPVETQINLDRGLGFRDPVRSRAVAIRFPNNTKYEY